VQGLQIAKAGLPRHAQVLILIRKCRRGPKVPQGGTESRPRRFRSTRCRRRHRDFFRPQHGCFGRKQWAIAEGYIPSESSFSDPALISHETACILNAGDRAARVRITVFFADRDPIGPYHVIVPARRTLHLRFNDLTDPAPLPRDTEYASIFESDVPIVVQHTRLDSRRAEVSLLSTVAFADT